MAGVAPNVQLAAVAAFVAACIEHAFAAYGHTLPPDIADGLPGITAIAVAQIHDMITGENKPAVPVVTSQAPPVVSKTNGNGS